MRRWCSRCQRVLVDININNRLLTRTAIHDCHPLIQHTCYNNTFIQNTVAKYKPYSGRSQTHHCSKQSWSYDSRMCLMTIVTLQCFENMEVSKNVHILGTSVELLLHIYPFGKEIRQICEVKNHFSKSMTPKESYFYNCKLYSCIQTH